jgi:hypothetical protein
LHRSSPWPSLSRSRSASRPRVTRGTGRSAGGSKARTRLSGTAATCARSRSIWHGSSSRCSGSIPREGRSRRTRNCAACRWLCATHRPARRSPRWRASSTPMR